MGTDKQDSQNVTTDSTRVFEDIPIIDVFAKPSNVRIMTVLVNAGGLPMTVSDITEQAGVTSQSVYNNIDRLKAYGLVSDADKIGNTQTYKVDIANESVQAFMSLYDTMNGIDPE